MSDAILRFIIKQIIWFVIIIASYFSLIISLRILLSLYYLISDYLDNNKPDHDDDDDGSGGDLYLRNITKAANKRYVRYNRMRKLQIGVRSLLICYFASVYIRGNQFNAEGISNNYTPQKEINVVKGNYIFKTHNFRIKDINDEFITKILKRTNNDISNGVYDYQKEVWFNNNSLVETNERHLNIENTSNNNVDDNKNNYDPINYTIDVEVYYNDTKSISKRDVNG